MCIARSFALLSFGLSLVGVATVGCGDDDGATGDAGREDAGREDAAREDAAREDSGPTDAGHADAAREDAGTACDPACGEARECCSGQCTNPANDPQSCGSCGRECGEGTYCTGGDCVTPPCTSTCAAGETCCGGECCAAGELCCDPQGPIDTTPRCTPPDERGTCPMGCAPLCMCASPDTPIATPEGPRPIASLGVGDLVYSVEDAAIVVVPIARVSRTPVTHHVVVRATLANRAVLEISGRHPTADGRAFSDLRAGDLVDGVSVTRVELVPYAHDRTYDILPASETASYFAGGVLIGSTLASR